MNDSLIKAFIAPHSKCNGKLTGSRALFFLADRHDQLNLVNVSATLNG